MLRLEKPQKAALLFGKTTNTMVQICLEKSMGIIYADEAQKPETAAACLGDFCFLEGKTDQTFFEELKTVCPDINILVPSNEEWAALIETVYGNQVKRIMRYAFLKEPHIWNLDDLEKTVVKTAASLQEGFEVRQIDEEIYQYAKTHPWAEDWVWLFPSYEEFAQRGLGFAIVNGHTPVAGASSYCAGRKAIEIQIDTHPDFRRKGLAFLCAAALILECEKRGIYPSWDAHNVESKALAEKLGYRIDKEYTAYILQEIAGKDKGGIR